MALNLFRTSSLTTNNRQLIIALINIRTHYTKTPNHHTKEKWRPFRREKILDIDLPDFDKDRKLRAYTLQEQREYFKREGIPPIRSAEYKPLFIDASTEPFEAYVPPEGDGKASFMSKDRLNQFYTSLKKNITTRKHSGTIRKHEPDFEPLLFAEIAQQKYIDAHQALMDRDEERLIQLVTPGSFSQMARGLRYKTLRWKWVDDIEPSYVVAIKSGEILKGMTMAQVTVRMHSKQTCAIYDRFGRLMFGNETLPKDVLEYVVFERVLTFSHSQWRVHSKILPSWLPPSDPLLYTFEKPDIKYIDEDTPTDAVEDEKKRDQIAKEQETTTRTMPGPSELKTPLPTLSDISQHNRKRTIGYS
ncbi:unnamed protein product [Rotaria magnacalcarata]|uniref:Large ribosomal subunit protein mL45 n=9 Tax=Rotaria magnacalcarata TaxID=392030 RepID=A0A816PI60_9BILA|nr:unnamed protein product [Rotaria magnacalcarata]CAF1603723.1 unnamed protein product [Rotaria magnacalcarata]CAF2048147.1 unnamed protein product [Rotaria magnacalcarata]CAF2140001.1 unnamed protein product [Rotaria magnacalcarata]CAF3781208.1 unnamed protein product [Rotaria magnacalcarata]